MIGFVLSVPSDRAVGNWKEAAERCAAVGIVLGMDSSPVRANDRTTDREAKAESLRPMRDERIKDGVELTFGNPDAAIGDGDLHALVVSNRGQGELTFGRLDRAHGIARVEHEIEDDLLQLNAVAHHGRNAW